MTLPVDENGKQSLTSTAAGKPLPLVIPDGCKHSGSVDSKSTYEESREKSKTRVEEAFIQLGDALQEYVAPVLSGAVLYLLLWLLSAIFGNREGLPWKEHADEFFCHAAFGDAVPIFLGLTFVGFSLLCSAHKVTRFFRALFINPVIDFAHHAALLGAGALIVFNMRTHHFGWAFWYSDFVVYLLVVGAELQAVHLVQQLTDDAVSKFPKVSYVYLCLGAVVLVLGGYFLVSDVRQVGQLSTCQSAHR